MEMATAYRTGCDCFKRRVRTVPELEKLRIHDIRHAYAMLALSAGNSMDAVADHPGHSSADFTRKVYSSFSREQRQRDAAATERNSGHFLKRFLAAPLTAEAELPYIR